MLLGDTHGNVKFITKVAIPAAISAGVRWIYQVGDFGYWEHTTSGETYLNAVSDALKGTNVELVFIPGNHDKVSLIPKRYNEVSGFYQIRSSLWFAPNGTHWFLGKTGFLVLGGAYSIDKQQRLEAEEAKARNLFIQRKQQRYQYPDGYLAIQAQEETAETLWFPEEEMTDEELDTILNSVKPEDVNVILAHDKPYMSNTGVKLLNIDETIPNQRRLQKAVNTLKPELFVHGHLHVRYRDTIRCGDNDAYTVVEGLGADVPNFNQLAIDWRADDAWEILHLED